MASLRTLVKDRIMAVISETETESGWKVMIVDSISVRIISAACRMYDITDEGVTIVENLEIERQPMADMDALYLITPTEDSVCRLCKDFADDNDPKYESAHIYFTSHLPDELLFSIRNTAGLRKRLKTLKMLNLEFIALEQRCFSLDLPDALHHLYGVNSPDGDFIRRRDEMEQTIADRLATMCVTLGERPYIRYKKGEEGFDSAERVAKMVDMALDNVERIALGVQLWDNLPVNDKPHLLIVDRSEDPLTPLMHDYSYQAMAFDLLDIRNDKYTYSYSNNEGKAVEKTGLLNELDPLWPKLRHLHVADATTQVVDDFNRFKSESKAAGLVRKEVTDIKDMAAAIKGMPQYKELVSKYSLHMDLTRKCMAAYEARGLEAVSTEEQNTATGSDSQGKAVKNQGGNIANVLQKLDPSDDDKMRLLLIHAMQEGVSETDLGPLVELTANPGWSIQTLENLAQLGVALQKKGGKPGFFRSKGVKHPKADGGGYDLARYKPPLQQVMSAMCDGKLGTDDYPFVSAPPSIKGAGPVSSRLGKSVRTRPRGDAVRSRLHHADDDDDDDNNDDDAIPKFVVFVVGGLSYSEVCSAYKVSRDMAAEIAVGSTEVMNPNRYLKCLENLDQELPPPILRTTAGPSVDAEAASKEGE